MYYDLNGDGYIDAVDANADGYIDAVDTNFDGIADVYDTNFDGVADTYDLNEDGVADGGAGAAGPYGGYTADEVQAGYSATDSSLIEPARVAGSSSLISDNDASSVL